MNKKNKKQHNLNKLKVLVTGGGSGGHVSAATSFIEKFLSNNDNNLNNLLYVGSKPVTESFEILKSIEQRRYENSPVHFTTIRSGKLQRSFSLKSIWLLLNVIGGLVDAYKVIKDFQPDFIFSTGGYVTVPIALIGRFKKIPVYLHEQTASIGLANKIVSKIAKKIFITFPQSSSYFPPEKTVHTGNLVRAKTWKKNGKGKLAEAIKNMKKTNLNLPIIYISGGGQGSHFLNIITRQMLSYILLDFQVILQTGENRKHKDYEVMLTEMKKLSPKLREHFFVTKFINSNEIGYLFNNIDMYLGRAGANTVYEMGLLQKPSVLIPIPWVTQDEQQKNAQILVDCGLGYIVPEGEVTAEHLFEKIKNFWQRQQHLTNKEQKEIRKKAEKIFIQDGAKRVISEIKKEF